MSSNDTKRKLILALYFKVLTISLYWNLTTRCKHLRGSTDWMTSANLGQINSSQQKSSDTSSISHFVLCLQKNKKSGLTKGNSLLSGADRKRVIPLCTDTHDNVVIILWRFIWKHNNPLWKTYCSEFLSLSTFHVIWKKIKIYIICPHHMYYFSPKFFLQYAVFCLLLNL